MIQKSHIIGMIYYIDVKLIKIVFIKLNDDYVSTNNIKFYNNSTGVLSMGGSNTVRYSSQMGTCFTTAYIHIVMFYIE